MRFLILIFLTSLSFAAQSQLVQDTSAIVYPKSLYETVSTDSVSVSYGRPSKSGCKIFGDLHKFGNVWKVGTDKSTTITFTRNVSFAGQNIEAGTYTLFIIPYENEWTIILNSELEQWGAYTYEKHKDKNVVSVNISVTQLITEVEQLTIRFPQSNNMIIEWDKTQVSIPIL